MRISVGDEDALEVLVTPEAVRSFMEVSGDDAPLHRDASFARARGFDGPLIHGALLTAYVSRLVGTRIPGVDALLERIDLSFRAPCYAPCRLRIVGRVRQISEAVASVALDITISAEALGVVATGKTFHRLLPAPDQE
jgi:acyl dehydratase